jgi:N-acetylglucosamine-6-sulfatase
MIRRLLILVAAVLAFPAAALAQPNVLLIVADDMRADDLAYMPTVQAELVGRGVSFTNGLVVDPLCCPSRATLLTGRYAHRHHVWRNNGYWSGMSQFDHSQTVAAWLDAVGYRTGWFGKYFNNYGGSWVPPGWDRWVAFSPVGYSDYTLNVDGVLAVRGSGESDYSTDVLAAETEDFIRSTPAEEPVFAVFIPFAPHTPETPALRHVGLYAGVSPPTGVTLADSWRSRVESLQAVDEGVGRLLAALADTGRLNDTLVLFTSDNGYLLGEHGLRGKSLPYEEAIRVPFVVRYDALGLEPREDRRLVGNLDVAPTLAELAGIAPPPGFVDGRSLLPLLQDPGIRGRERLFVESLRALRWAAHPGTTFCQIREPVRTYVQYGNGREALFNLRLDPRQQTNRAGSRSPWVRRLIRSYRWKVLHSGCRPPGMQPLTLAG